jgi:hypothetical protein
LAPHPMISTGNELKFATFLLIDNEIKLAVGSYLFTYT